MLYSNRRNALSPCILTTSICRLFPQSAHNWIIDHPEVHSANLREIPSAHGCVIPSAALFSGAEGPAFVFRSASAADAQATPASSPALPSIPVPLLPVLGPRSLLHLFTDSLFHSFTCAPPPVASHPTPHAVLRDCETVKLWSAQNQQLAATVSQSHSSVLDCFRFFRWFFRAIWKKTHKRVVLHQSRGT